MAEKKKSALMQTSAVIEDCVKLSIDTEQYGYTVIKNMKKIKTGAFTISVHIYLKHNPDVSKSILFIVDKDTRTSLIHVSIIDANPLSPSILFTTSEQFPANKLEKYIPSIVISTQNMIK